MNVSVVRALTHLLLTLNRARLMSNGVLIGEISPPMIGKFTLQNGQVEWPFGCYGLTQDSVLHCGGLHVEHLSIFLKLLLVEDTTLGPE